MTHRSISSNPRNGMAALVTRLVLRRQRSLLGGRIRTLVCSRALPLDLSEARPLDAALERNIKAALRARALPIYC